MRHNLLGWGGSTAREMVPQPVSVGSEIATKMHTPLPPPARRKVCLLPFSLALCEKILTSENVCCSFPDICEREWLSQQHHLEVLQEELPFRLSRWRSCSSWMNPRFYAIFFHLGRRHCFYFSVPKHDGLTYAGKMSCALTAQQLNTPPSCTVTWHSLCKKNVLRA